MGVGGSIQSWRYATWFASFTVERAEMNNRPDTRRHSNFRANVTRSKRAKIDFPLDVCVYLSINTLRFFFALVLFETRRGRRTRSLFKPFQRTEQIFYRGYKFPAFEQSVSTLDNVGRVCRRVCTCAHPYSFLCSRFRGFHGESQEPNAENCRLLEYSNSFLSTNSVPMYITLIQIILSFVIVPFLFLFQRRRIDETFLGTNKQSINPNLFYRMIVVDRAGTAFCWPGGESMNTSFCQYVTREYNLIFLRQKRSTWRDITATAAYQSDNDNDVFDDGARSINQFSPPSKNCARFRLVTRSFLFVIGLLKLLLILIKQSRATTSRFVTRFANLTAKWVLVWVELVKSTQSSITRRSQSDVTYAHNRIVMGGRFERGPYDRYATRSDDGYQYCSHAAANQSLSITITTFVTVMHTLPVGRRWIVPQTAQSCLRTRHRLLWSARNEACNGAWNADGMISIIQMNIYMKHGGTVDAILPTVDGRIETLSKILLDELCLLVPPRKSWAVPQWTRRWDFSLELPGV